jgi:hypothetical protein
MDKEIQGPEGEDINKELEHYKERAKDLGARGLIEKEDEKHVMNAEDPDEAKVTLLTALERKHKKSRESYIDSAGKERQDGVDSGLA